MTTQFRWYGDDVSKKIRKAGSKGLNDASEFLAQESNKTCPKREGILRQSVGVSVEGLEATVFYDTPYAVRVHETPGLNYSEPGARWKWLEYTAKEQMQRVLAFIQKALVGVKN